MKGVINFIKYNNASVIILIMVFIIGSATFASETGREMIGTKNINIVGEDNLVLLETDLENLDFEFQIENIEEDDEFMYVVYTYRPLEKENGVWKFLIIERTIKISKKSIQRKHRFNLESYILKEFKQIRSSLLKNLKKEKEKAEKIGKQERVQVIEYTGLQGVVLNIFSKTGSVKKNIIENNFSREDFHKSKYEKLEFKAGLNSGVDNLSNIYNDYVDKLISEGKVDNDSKEFIFDNDQQNNNFNLDSKKDNLDSDEIINSGDIDDIISPDDQKGVGDEDNQNNDLKDSNIDEVIKSDDNKKDTDSDLDTKQDDSDDSEINNIDDQKGVGDEDNQNNDLKDSNIDEVIKSDDNKKDTEPDLDTKQDDSDDNDSLGNDEIINNGNSADINSAIEGDQNNDTDLE